MNQESEASWQYVWSARMVLFLALPWPYVVVRFVMGVEHGYPYFMGSESAQWVLIGVLIAIIVPAIVGVVALRFRSIRHGDPKTDDTITKPGRWFLLGLGAVLLIEVVHHVGCWWRH